MEMKKAGCLIGVLVTLVTVSLSQPIVPSYYYSGPYGADPRTAAAFQGGYTGYGTDAASLAAAAVAGYPYSDSYYFNPATWNNWGVPNYYGNSFSDWGSYLPTDPTSWTSFLTSLPGDIRTSWNSYYSLYGSGVPNAASLWGGFLSSLSPNLQSTWRSWWGNNYGRRWNTVRYVSGWPLKKK